MNPFLRHSTLAVCALALVATGCKKSADETAAAADADGKSSAPAVPQKGDAEAAQAISGVNTALQKNDYDAAIAALVAAKQSGTMSDAQKDQYRQAMRDASTKLLEASQHDAKAKEAYENLGRLMKGH